MTLGLGAQQAQQGAELDDEDYYADEGGAPGRRIALCADPAVGERLYCVHPAGAPCRARCARGARRRCVPTPLMLACVLL